MAAAGTGNISKGSHLRSQHFSCKGRHEGYYADVASRCKVFHLCKNGVQYSFVCPKGTLFHEAISVCDWKSSVVCRAPVKKPPKHRPKAPKYRPRPRGGRHGPRRTEEPDSPAYHVHYLLPDDHNRKNKKKSAPVTLVIAGDLRETDKKREAIPDTILYQHDHETKSPPPDTIVYEHHEHEHPPIHDDIPNTLLYEHDPNVHEEVPDYLVFEHQGIRENKHRKQPNKKSSRDPQTLIFLVDEYQHGKDQNYLKPEYDPVEEAYFAEDEYDNLRDFFVHADNNDYISKGGHYSPNTRGYKIPGRPTRPHKHSIHVYDPHLHNLSDHSKKPDVLISLPKRTNYKPHRNEYTSKIYDSDEPYFEKPTSHYSKTQPPSTPLTLKPVTKSIVITNSQDNRNSQIPNLSATDIMSSLFLQSLLVKALEQFNNPTTTTTTERPPSTVPSVAMATSAVQTNPRPAQLMASRLNVHDSSSGPYRYRKILQKEEEVNEDAETIPPSDTSVSIPKSEKLILETRAIPEMLTEASMIVTRTVSTSPPVTTTLSTTVSTSPPVTTTLSTTVSTSPPVTTPLSTTPAMTTLNPFIEALMRIVNNSTIMISKDPMVMVMNNPPSAELKENEVNVTEMATPINAGSVSNVTSDLTSSNNTNDEQMMEEDVSQNKSIPGFVDMVKNVTLKNEIVNVTKEIIENMINNTSLPIDAFQNNYSVAKNNALQHSGDAAHPLLRNLEIHVHVHTPEPKVRHKEEDYKIRHVTSSHRPYSVRTPAGHRIKSLFPPKVLRTPYPQTPLISTTSGIRYPLSTNSRVRYPISTTSGVGYLHRKPRLSFVTTIPTTSYPKPQPFSTKPPLLIEHRLTEASSPEQYRHEESKPTGYRIKLPDTATSSPIEYDIIVSRKPPVVDGEVIPTPLPQQAPLVSTSSPTRRPPHPSPITRPPRPPALTFVDAPPRVPSPVNSNVEHIAENAAAFSLPDLTHTHRPSISFGTFKPVQSIHNNIPQFFRPTLSSTPNHFPGSSIHSGSTLKIPFESSTPQPVHNHILYDAPQHVSHNSIVRHPFFNRIHLENGIDGFPLAPQTTAGQSSNGYVIPHGYFDGNIKALSAFNSLPDMFASSYSLPLPIQPHMK